MPAVSLSTLYRAVARELGPVGIPTTTATAVGPDPARWIIAVQSAAPTVRIDGAPPERWVGAWAYLATGALATQQRRVAWSVPEAGALAMDALFGDTVATGVEVVLSYPLPVIGQHDSVGLADIVRMALRDLWAEDYLDLTTVAAQREYSLSTYTDWLNRDDRILGLYDPPRFAGAPRRPSRFGERGRGWDVKFDGGAATLQLLDAAYAASGFTFQLRVRRPAYSLVSGSESTTGPTTDAATVTAELDDVVVVSLLHAYRALAGYRWLPEDERQRFAGLIPEQEARARALRSYEPREQPAAAGQEAA